jgi:hypothetical protein
VIDTSFKEVQRIANAIHNLGEGEVFDMLHGLYARIEELELERDEAIARLKIEKSNKEVAEALFREYRDLAAKRLDAMKELRKERDEARARVAAVAEGAAEVAFAHAQRYRQTPGGFESVLPFKADAAEGVGEDIRALATDEERDARRRARSED